MVANIAVKLPVFLDGVVDPDIEDFLNDFLPSHVTAELKAEGEETLRRLSHLTISAHANHTNRTAFAATSPGPPIPPSSDQPIMPTNQVPATHIPAVTSSASNGPRPGDLPLASFDFSGVTDHGKLFQQEQLGIFRVSAGTAGAQRRHQARGAILNRSDWPHRSIRDSDHASAQAPARCLGR